MKTERELFEEWADSNSYYLHKNTDGSYEKGSTAMAWEIWQASANREGYKLVPCEPTKEMLIAADNCVIDGKVTSHNIYKAMIGASE